MKQKYEKPNVRDLGTSLSDAEGLCYNGSLATGAPGAHCIPFGGTASGAYCSEGIVPTNIGCSVGKAPTAHGCLLGTYASLACSQGNNFG
jgi:hypothetical protein